ncbi:LemA family protein [Candidatus Woesebacteria bacterium]|jgi:LemA protein|nr:LemA family protein [Candidatus Woesebacteria bacterium]MBP9687848.1 LemA family protein [Candidatus Woesebacteria bacterium]
MPILLLLIIAIVIGFWVMSTYNFFVSSKARIKASIQEIGNQLKRQADLIPNLEASAKGFLKHEKGIFDELTSARKAVSSAVSSGDINKMAEAGSRIGALLPQIQVAVEDNPEIKGTEVVKPLMDELRDTADKVMYARRLLIDLTADYNVRIATFPSSLIANAFSFKELDGLKTPLDGDHITVSEMDTKTPKVSL